MSLYVRAIDGMSNHTAADLRGDMADLLTSEGVVDLDGGHCLVEENTVPDMSVIVNPGIAYVLNDSWTEFASTQRYWDVLIDAEENPTIGANASGSTRIDLICIKVDTGVTPDANASNVATVVVVAGTPGAGAPALPIDHLLLAEITVANGATSITNSNISDERTSIQIRESIGGSRVGDDGWTSKTNETWTRTGNHTFTVPTNLTAVYKAGTKVRYKQGGSYEYGTVKSSSYSAPNTTVTLVTNDDYAMAASTITDNYISYQGNPEGFPNWFVFSVTFGGFSVQPTPSTLRFQVVGGECHVKYTATGNGTSNDTPITCAGPMDAQVSGMIPCIGRGVDNGSTQSTPALVTTTAGIATLTFYKDQAQSNWTNSGAKSINFDFSYEYDT